MHPGDDPIALENDELHRRAAEVIRRDPTAIEKARATLERWIERRGGEPPPAWQEWRVAFRMLSPTELARFLESTTPRARRMKISSPFFALLAV